MVAKSASFGHGSLVCGLWLAGGDRGGSVSTYVLSVQYSCAVAFIKNDYSVSLFLKKQITSQNIFLVKSELYSIELHPYSHYRFSKILRFCVSRN